MTPDPFSSHELGGVWARDYARPYTFHFPSTSHLIPLTLSLPPPHIPSPSHLCVLPSLCALPLAVKLGVRSLRTWLAALKGEECGEEESWDRRCGVGTFVCVCVCVCVCARPCTSVRHMHSMLNNRPLRYSTQIVSHIAVGPSNTIWHHFTMQAYIVSG